MFRLLFLSHSFLPSLSPSSRSTSALDAYFIFLEIMLQNTIKKKKASPFPSSFSETNFFFDKIGAWRPSSPGLGKWSGTGRHSDQCVELSVEHLAKKSGVRQTLQPLLHLSAGGTKMSET